VEIRLDAFLESLILRNLRLSAKKTLKMQSGEEHIFPGFEASEKNKNCVGKLTMDYRKSKSTNMSTVVPFFHSYYFNNRILSSVVRAFDQEKLCPNIGCLPYSEGFTRNMPYKAFFFKIHCTNLLVCTLLSIKCGKLIGILWTSQRVGKGSTVEHFLIKLFFVELS